MYLINNKYYYPKFNKSKDQNLQPIETDEEWDMIENVLSELQKAATDEQN